MSRPVAAQHVVEFRVLGSIEVRVDGLAVEITGFRQRRILAVLLSRGGEVVATDTLAEYVWDDNDRPDNAAEAVRTYISRTRRSLSDSGLDAQSILVTQSPGYRLALDDVDLDSATFELLVVEARAHLDGGDAVAALVALDDSLALWSGSAYQEFADRSWVEAEVARLAELRRVALEQRASARLELGAHAEVVGDLEQLVAEDPLRARPVELLMLALYRSNRQAAALRVYAAYRRALTEIGLDPPESVAALESRIAASDEGLRPVIASTDTIRGYRLAEQIGEGSFSVVYRSVQPSLGREVAVKQIRAELADQPDFIRRFETEAQTVAGLEHPHIVPLYDYWREPGSAYLVMRWLRGGTLESRLGRQRLDSDESVTLATQIGSALAMAHHAGVEHGDVRTANVFVDEIGNNYLGDFGIAMTTDGRGSNGAAGDVRGLGTVLFESVTGKSGKDVGDVSLATVRPDLPAAVEGVLLRAILGGSDEGYADVDEFVDAYATAINGSGGARSRSSHPIPHLEDISNPYKGLRAFQESDAEDFRGRDRLVERLLWQMAAGGTGSRFVAAVGPSGSGKSSLVRAGLVPRVRAGAIDGSEQWFVTSMLPSARPFDALEAALNRIATSATTGLAEVMKSGPNGIARAVDSVLPDESSEMLVVIDQFEELFTLVDDEVARRAFLEGLVTAVSDDRSRLRVVVTIRADHWHRPLQYPDVARLLETSAVTVTPMAADELERAIADPARRMGVTFEPGLISDIVAEVHDQPGALPPMQHLLTELFDARQAGLMELDAYRRLGGVAGGLARRADELYEECSESQQEGVRRLFSRLITPGDGVEDTRRRVRLSELTMVSDDVIARFGAAQMLSFDHDPATREPTVEVAHEALIREWPRLRAWVDDDRDGLRIMRRLTVAAGDWDAGDRPESELFRGGRLETAAAWAADHTDDLTESEREFLAASLDRQEQEVADERAGVRRLRRLLAATAVIAVIALVAGAIAWSQQRRADESAREAERERQASEEIAQRETEARASAESARDDAESARQEADTSRDAAVTAAELERDARQELFVQGQVLRSSNIRDDQPTLSLLLALEAHERAPSPETLGALFTSLQRTDGYLGAMPSTVAWNNDQWLGLLDDETVIVRTPVSIDVYDLTSRELVRSIPSVASPLTFAPVGSAANGRFVTVDAAGDVLLVEGETTEVSTFTIDETRAATSAGLGEDGSLIVGYRNGDVEVFAESGPVPVALDGHHVPVTHVALNEDATNAVTKDELGNLTLWDVEAAEARWTISYGAPERRRPGVPTVGTPPVEFGLLDGGPPVDQADERAPGVTFDWSLAFGRDQQTVLWNAAGLLAFDVETGLVVWGAESPVAARQIFVTTSGAIIRGNQRIVDGFATEITSGVVPAAQTVTTSDEATLVALDSAGITVWALNGDQLLARGFDRGTSNVASLSRDGERLAAFFRDPLNIVSEGAVLDTATGIATAVAPGGSHWIYFNAGDDLVSFHTEDRLAGISDPDTLDATTPPIFAPTWGTIESNPAGDVVAISSHSGAEIKLYDPTNWDAIATLTEPVSTVGSDEPVFWIDFSPDGRYIAASNLDSVAVWETTGWTEVAHVLPQEGGTFTAVAFAPDGDELGIRNGDGDVFLHDIDAAQTHRVVGGTVSGGQIYGANSFEYSDDGRYIVVTGDAGLTLVDADAGQIVGGQIPSDDALRTGATVANGGRAAVTATEDHLLVWNLDPATWRDIACLAAGRNMTLEEWEQFGGVDEPYHATCPQWDNSAANE